MIIIFRTGYRVSEQHKEGYKREPNPVSTPFRQYTYLALGSLLITSLKEEKMGNTKRKAVQRMIG
ncbi:uncharacterized protein PADG_02379 [Paracoccidioides brasiliensis Pb18]|uniref:Uncharacterized protein n=1 Tax=Paracoccidioides brasiliensis (strain Pb18) TaxID=502780 RepID=C1G2L3_PARBD|nr:uncharacterized protein PADG_02379 [Paracoccidioides brasiliensis Pb18]EEH46229.2 hypothetical protein PADG_02379 [Paracoccidioides brasiliensis Pb18]